MNWQIKHQIYAVLIIMFIIASFTLWAFWPKIFKAPTCDDNIMNGTELGIDCGGGCKLACQSQITPPKVLSTDLLKTGDNIYDLLIMVDNKNVNYSIPNIKASINVYDNSNQLIYNDVRDYPIIRGKTFPILLENINLINPTRIQVSLNSSNWTVPVSSGPDYVINKVDFVNDKISKLTLQFSNTTRINYNKIKVIAVLYDKDAKPYAAGSTIVDSFMRDTITTANFTWNREFTTKPNEVKLYIFTDEFR